MLKRLFFCFFVLFFVGFSAFAQTPTTQGTEFWLSFMRNGYRKTGANEKITLIASAKRACTVTVSNPYYNWQRSFQVNDHDVTSFLIPDEYGYNSQKGGKAFKGLYVTSTDTISLYLANEATNSYDAANVLPVPALGSEYMIQSNKSIGEQGNHNGENRASFLIVATEDDTEVQITPSCQTYDNHLAGQTYTIELERGECYHVINKQAGSNTNSEGDFSGTMVVSSDNKPIAVFNGNCITSIGGVSEGYDHVCEQAMPTDHWGKRFVVTSIYPYPTLGDDLVKITALQDQTIVTRDGVELCQLSAGQSFSFTMSLNNQPVAYLEADKPVAVFVYNHSHGSGNPVNYGDPSMVWISPVEQTIYEVTFSTFEAINVEHHYINVVCYTEHVAELTLDNVSIAESFQEVPSFPEFSYARYHLEEPGAYTLRCPGGFVAHVYGFGDVEGYAYTVGSSAKILTKQLYVNDILSTDLPEGYTICQHETVDFRVETNYDFHHVAWDFGDGESDEGAEVSHEFAADGDFDVEAVVYREMDRDVRPFDTLGVTIHVNPEKEFHLDTIATCFDTYLFEGEEYPVPGDYAIPHETAFGCDSIVCLHLVEGVEIPPMYLDTVATCEETYHFDGVEYPVPGSYPVVYEMPDGCDSIVYVTIKVPDEIPPVYLDTVVTCADTYHFDGVDYPVPGVHEIHYETAIKCDSTVYLTLEKSDEVSYTWPPVVTCEATAIFEGEEYDVPGSYHLLYELPGGCDSTVYFSFVLGHDTTMFLDTVVTCSETILHDGVEYPVPGDYVIPYETEIGCDSVVYLSLRQKEAATEFLTEAACEQFEWFDEIYTETNHHLEHLVPFATPDGCDSLYILDLTVFPNGDQYFEIDTCDFYQWLGETYYESNYFEKEIEGENGCVSHLYLDLTLHQSPPFEQILGREIIAVATNFWPGEYVYFLDDSTGMDPSHIHWELRDDPGWGMRARGASCVINAYTKGSAVLHVWTTGGHKCDLKEAFKYITCSGFAVDETEEVSLEIFPNPARDALFVKGEGIGEVILYDLMGRKLRETAVGGETLVSVSLGDLAPMLYIVEVRTVNGNKTQLVSVIK